MGRGDSWWRRKSCNACGFHNHWKDTNRVLVFGPSRTPAMQRCFGFHAPLQGPWEAFFIHVLNCFVLFAKERRPFGGHDLRMFAGQSRLSIANEGRWSIRVDNQEAVNIGDLEKFRGDKDIFPHPAVREGIGRVIISRRSSRYVAFFHQPRKCGSQQMKSTVRGRGLTRSLSSHLRKDWRERNWRICLSSSWF